MRHHLKAAGRQGEVSVRSAGTRAGQRGAKPDQRGQRVAAAAGIALDSIRARKVTENMLINAHFVYAMDKANLNQLLKICPREHRHKIGLFLGPLAEHEEEDVPDPYYGSYHSFERVFELIDSAALAMVAREFWLEQ